MFGAKVAVIKKWKISALDASNSKELADLERKIEFFQKYASALDKVGKKRVRSYAIDIVCSERNYTEIESSGNYLKFNSEGKDGMGAHLEVYCEVGADGLPRYDFRINEYHYKVIPKKSRKI
ncbi:MAG: hypothetical protein Q8R47_05645 [Nanoarchaeota archaeon]|nr:hypothetical protein [Nanoarchaeota archaeon]